MIYLQLMEMNIFVCQSIQTQIELEEIAAVERQIITPTSSKTIVGIVQDGLLGAYNLTSPTVRIDWRNAMNIMSYTSLENFSSIKKNQDCTGSNLFSLIIPPGISMSKATLKIKNGQITEGRLTNDALGAKKKNNLIQLIWDGCGVQDTRKFIDDTQRLVNNFNLWNGFSCGIGDTEVPASVYDEIEKMFQTKELQIEHIVTEMENNPDLMKEALYELKLFSELNIIRDDVSKLIMANLTALNSFSVMATSGSKGNATNMGQMSGCLGLQAFEGKIMPKKYNHRTLPYFHQHDDRAVSRGLVKQSFIRGMEYPEFVFHLMASRLGIIEQAIKSVTGDTAIVIQEDGETKDVNIGDWIDQLMKGNKGKVVKEGAYDMESLELKGICKVTMPTCDEKGVTSWGELTSVTRHDPTKSMYKVVTDGGREVTIADSKTLLVWSDDLEKFVPMTPMDAKIGDCVPVAWKLAKPPVIVNSVDMTKYFPKNEYLYGTDFWLADKMIKEVVVKHAGGQTPRGWWAEHNGSTFTTPYWRAADLMRATKIRMDTGKATDTDSIENGYIYPFSKCREHGLPEKFPLTRENGVFIGLFLADGNADIPSGYVQITKNDKSIQKFTKKWFEKNHINCTITEYEKTVGVNSDVKGKFTEIRGWSTMLGKFLEKFVGHKAENKFVPDIAFSAPDEFVKGLLDGYFSGDGHIRKNSIDVGSVSRRLVEGISMLCSRFGIFARIHTTQLKSNNLGTEDILPMHHMDIRGQFAKQFVKIIELTHDDKEEKLCEMEPSKVYKNYSEQKDVVFDTIKSIEKVDVKNYKKLYDVTIPSTLKLGVRCGIILEDTAETGYAQRKLIKSMEDIMIKYDNTVRSANDGIIQFVYGDSGADTTKQYDYKIDMVELNNEDVATKHKFSAQELKMFKGFGDKDNDKLYKDILGMRDIVRETVRKCKMNYIVLTSNFMLPVNLVRIIDTVLGDSALKSKDELTPQHVIEQLELLLTNTMTTVICMSEADRNNANSFKRRDELLHKIVFKTALYDILSPKKVIVGKQLNKKQFDTIINEISNSFNKNIVEAGEMVGIIAAQSNGEPLTQMTLNSFHHSGIATLSSQLGGVPRIKELLGNSKKPKTPSMMIYFTDEYSASKDMAHKVASHIKHTTLGEVRGRINVYYDPQPMAKGSIMEKDNIKSVFHHHKGTRTGCQQDINGLPWLLRIELNREKMLEKEVNLLDINTKFCSWWEKRFNDTKATKKEEKKVISKITQLAVLSNTDNDKQPLLHIRFNVKDTDKDKDKFDLSTINNFIDHIVDTFKLKGISGVTDIPAIQEERALVFNPENGNVDRKSQYVVYTAGVNLLDIRYLTGIDLTKTISNHVIEMYNVFGIEVARAVLLREIANAYERAGGEVNYQHISMIVDQMTASGQINSVDRHGMNKSDSDPLCRASFEKTVEQMLIASVYGETDHMRGVSSRIMAGAVVKGGTGYCDLELDTDMIEKSEQLEGVNFTKKFTELNKGTLAEDIIKKKGGKSIFVPM